MLFSYGTIEKTALSKTEQLRQPTSQQACLEPNLVRQRPSLWLLVWLQTQQHQVRKTHVVGRRVEMVAGSRACMVGWSLAS